MCGVRSVKKFFDILEEVIEKEDNSRDTVRHLKQEERDKTCLDS